MQGLYLAVEGAISQGVLWGILALGVYITFRILNIADMSVDGSFVSGAAVASVLIVNEVSPILAIIAASIAGLIAGMITGILITKLEIPSILAGILTQIGLYSINLRIMDRSNLPLLQSTTLFKQVSGLTNLSITHATLLSGIIIVTVVIVLTYWFFGTELGSAIRAVGNNEKMVSAQGININNMKIIGLMLSNSLIALSGALISQSQGYADIKMGTGAIIVGIASIVIGEVIFGSNVSFYLRFISTIVGSVIYRIIIALILQLGLNPDDLKLITALIVGVALSLPIVLDKRSKLNAYKKSIIKEQNNVEN